MLNYVLPWQKSWIIDHHKNITLVYLGMNWLSDFVEVEWNVNCLLITTDEIQRQHLKEPFRSDEQIKNLHEESKTIRLWNLNQ